MGLDSKKFANDVFMHRTKLGLSRHKAADLAGINRGTMQTIEEGERGVNAHNFIDLCTWMQKDLNEFKI